MNHCKKSIYIDPYSKHAIYKNNGLFEREFALKSIRSNLLEKGNCVNTADFMYKRGFVGKDREYYSLGNLRNYEILKKKYHIKLKYFYIFEPPVVRPVLYRKLAYLSEIFEKIFIWNMHGDGYSLKNVQKTKLHKLFYPQPYKGILKQYWAQTNRQNRLVMINSNLRPRNSLGRSERELYSKRIDAVVALSKKNMIDLYGRWWNRLWWPGGLWLPYYLNYKTLMSVYKGTCQSKYEVLSRYHFSLCFENMKMDGYITEKFFDCLYSGTVPIYLGARDISQYIPKSCYIDSRQFNEWYEIKDFIDALSMKQIKDYKNAGRTFLESKQFYDLFCRGFINSFNKD